MQISQDLSDIFVSQAGEFVRPHKSVFGSGRMIPVRIEVSEHLELWCNACINRIGKLNITTEHGFNKVINQIKFK